MAEDTIYVYMNPNADLSTFPSDMYGDMSVFWNPSLAEDGVQWMHYLVLKDQGLDVQVCRKYPKEGILLIPRAEVSGFVWNPNLFVVSLQYDYKRDDRAQMHILSNQYSTKNIKSGGFLDWLSCPGIKCYVPSVMHTQITPRDAARGERFEHIVFNGAAKNLDEELKSHEFLDQLESMGIQLSIIDDPSKQTDYSNFDGVLAVRKFGRTIHNKPPVKLINAWRAEVPAILGREIGFIESRQSEYDYLEVDSVDDTLKALARIKDDAEFRDRIVANARKRAEPYSAEGQRKIWVEFMQCKVVPAYEKWQKKPMVLKYAFLSVRWIRHVLRGAMSFIWHDVLRLPSRDYV